jgi:hypothetical protein
MTKLPKRPRNTKKLAKLITEIATDDTSQERPRPSRKEKKAG